MPYILKIKFYSRVFRQHINFLITTIVHFSDTLKNYEKLSVSMADLKSFSALLT